ncbi:hypothetical protein MRBL20_004415 [Peribacillus frigoritolerans]
MKLMRMKDSRHVHRECRLFLFISELLIFKRIFDDIDFYRVFMNITARSSD